MHLLLLALRLLHIVGGILWVGFAVFLPFFLSPVLSGLGVDGGKVMAGLQRRGLMTLLPLLALTTILSGAALLWRVSGGQPAEFVARPMGVALTVGALLAILAFAIGMLISRPAAVRIGGVLQRLASAAPGERELLQATIAGLQRRVAATGRLASVLLLIAATAMALARYL